MTTQRYPEYGCGDDSARDQSKRSIRIFARVLGVSAALFIILAQDHIGPTYFDPLGKALFWTGIVLIPVFVLNHDVLRFGWAKILAIVQSALQILLVWLLFEKLSSFSFITLTPLCLIQSFFFTLSFMPIRKRNCGIWY